MWVEARADDDFTSEKEDNDNGNNVNDERKFGAPIRAWSKVEKFIAKYTNIVKRANYFRR
jgi:hypothetical protein